MAHTSDEAIAMKTDEAHERCSISGCTGERAPTLDACFVHADDALFSGALKEAIGPLGSGLNLRGTPLNQAAVDRILHAVPSDASSHRLLDEVDMSGARPTEPLKIAHASFQKLRLDGLASKHGIRLDIVLRGFMSMYDMRCADLDLRLEGEGKVIADRLHVDDHLLLRFDSYRGTFRGSPMSAETTRVTASSASNLATVQLDVRGEDCSVIGGHLERLEIRDGHLDADLAISDIEVDDGIFLTGTRATNLDLERCTADGLVLDGIRIAGDVHASELKLGTLLARSARVEHEATFRDAKLQRLTASGGAYFGVLDLAGCSITELLDVSDTQLGHLALDRSKLARVSLSLINVAGLASLRDAVLSAPLLISEAKFAGSLNLNGISARQGVTLSGVRVSDVLGAFRAAFEGDLRSIDVDCVGLTDLRELRVAGALAIELCSATVDLSDATIAGPSRLRLQADVVLFVGATLQSRGEIECRGRSLSHACALDLRGIEPRERLLIDGQDRSSLIDLRRARCDGIRLQAVALDRCLFEAATGLEEMRLTGESFARRSTFARRGRVVLAEDPAFVRALLRDRGGTLPAPAEPVLDGRRKATPAQMAQLYRSLRKGLEDSKDSAGASDFYFAEMQMRRANQDTGAFERTLLNAYRSFGGYGVRPLAPAIWLVVLVIVASLGATALGAIRAPTPSEQRVEVAPLDCRIQLSGGIPGVRCERLQGTVNVSQPRTEHSFGQAALIVAGSTFAFTRALDARLEPAGQMIVIVVRLLGAVLLALVALGLRSAVRR